MPHCSRAARRPGQGPEWQAVLRRRVLDNVGGCGGSVVVHTGSWRHDLDQARCLPTQGGIKVQVRPHGASRCRTVRATAAPPVGCSPPPCSWSPGARAHVRSHSPRSPIHAPTPCRLPVSRPSPQIYSVESHRLALALDRRGLLVQIVRSAILQAMGLPNKDNMRLANLF